MKIEIDSKKVFIDNGNNREEIHPFWLRERINTTELLDESTQQRLFDPTTLNNDISIDKINASNGIINFFFY